MLAGGAGVRVFVPDQTNPDTLRLFGSSVPCGHRERNLHDDVPTTIAKRDLLRRSAAAPHGWPQEVSSRRIAFPLGTGRGLLGARKKSAALCDDLGLQ